MTDEKRSRNMAAIHASDTKPEVYLRKLLYHHGYRYRKNWKLIKGRPDLFVLRYKVALFVNGCFWHAHHGCASFRVPATHKDFWDEKFRKNTERDQRTLEELHQLGIRTAVVWECAVNEMKKSPAYEEVVLDTLDAFFRSAELHLEIEPDQ